MVKGRGKGDSGSGGKGAHSGKGKGGGSAKVGKGNGKGKGNSPSDFKKWDQNLTYAASKDDLKAQGVTFGHWTFASRQERWFIQARKAPTTKDDEQPSPPIGGGGAGGGGVALVAPTGPAAAVVDAASLNKELIAQRLLQKTLVGLQVDTSATDARIAVLESSIQAATPPRGCASICLRSSGQGKGKAGDGGGSGRQGGHSSSIRSR